MTGRLIEITPIKLPEKGVAEPESIVGKFERVSIANLRVDKSYQRDITGSSAKNILRIAKNFNWNRFAPVIGVRLENETVAIIDGQHRTTAAKSLGIESVPVYILDASYQEAAGAFAAINGVVTSISPCDLYFARIVAEDPEALELKKVLDSANVRIVRHANGHAVGETRAVNVLFRAIKVYGAPLLTTILQCITETGNGNAGLIKGVTVNGIGFAIRSKPHLYELNTSRMFEIFDNINLAGLLRHADIENAQTGNPKQYILTRMINEQIKNQGVKNAT